ncbi:MAG TPA: HupE/UreJ family protein [Longimicrobiales bacterium]|nr:HupE/UreJ family protein [Longimicrobiales bacterium]
MSRRSTVTLTIAAALLLGLPARPSAHEIPATVTVQAFVKPDGARLRLLVRVPLESMRDIDVPVRGSGYLDLVRVEPLLMEAATLWIAGYIAVLEDGRPLESGRVAGTRISLPSDPSFSSYDAALASMAAPALDAATALPWQQAMLDVLIEYPITSPRSEFAIEPALAHLGIRTTTVLRFVPPDGAERVYTFTGNPGVVRLDPRWHHAAAHFTRLGFAHIFAGLDHLLFLLCLVIPFRRWRPLLLVVTSFTVAHSITLIASAAGLAPGALWFPPLIEMLIALSIVWMALENIVGANLERRWLFAFGFGLVHGFGFSFMLREALQFAGSHLTAALLAFNVGVELGQIAVLVIAVPALTLLFRHVVAERIGTIVLSALVAHSGWHWMTERGNELRQYQLAWPVPDAALAAAAVRALMLILIAGVALWAIRGLAERLERAPRRGRESWRDAGVRETAL